MWRQIALILGVMLMDQTTGFRLESDCPSYCSCNYFESKMVVSCNDSQLNSMFRLPHRTLDVANTTSVNCMRSHLKTMPLNLCEYAPTLVYLDLSDNKLVENLNPNHVGCLTNLRFLNLSHNLISFVDANTFNSMLSLEVLDLSHNRLTMIPTYLFYLKVPNMNRLYLNHNQLTEVDVWMLWMEHIHLIDLSHNQIVSIVNRIGWNPYFVSSSVKIRDSSLIDLSSNKLRSFDDDLLAKFQVCTIAEFRYFMELFQQFRLSHNPVDCSCSSSYNMLKLYQSYAQDHLIPADFEKDRLFSARCSSPPTYHGLSIFTFVNPAVCETTATAFSSTNCGFLAQNNSLLSKIEKEMFDLETIAQVTKDATSPSLINAQIAVLISASIGLLLLILVLIYCICPVEVLAILFNTAPLLYSVFPCRNRQKKKSHPRDQTNDLFISYNKSNERWVKNKLVPFIKNNNLVDSFALHYGPDNKNKDLFNVELKSVMSRSDCTLFVVSQQFLTHEWSNFEFRQHLRNLVGKNDTRLVCIQMHDVMEEQIDEYFVNELRLPRFVLLQNEELMFWTKLAYFLFTNNSNDRILAPRIQVKPLGNKIHTKTSLTAEKATNRSSSSDGSRPSTNSDSKPIFEVSRSYKNSLPPLRIPKRLEECKSRNRDDNRVEAESETKGSSKIGSKRSQSGDKTTRVVSFDMNDVYRFNKRPGDELYIFEKSDFV